MRHLRLRQPQLALRAESGSTQFPLPSGEVLRLGPGFGPLLDELARGVPESVWIRLERDPAFAALVIALSEHRLLESADVPRTGVWNFQVKSRGVGRTGTPLIYCFVLLTWAGTVFAMCRVSIASPQQQLQVWSWALMPVASVFVLIMHEFGHAAAAYACGCRPRILLWSGDAFMPRCVLAADGTSLSVGQRNLILAAGPTTDAVIVLAAALTRQFHGIASSWPTMVALCATFAVIANLRPSGNSDMNQILLQIVDPRFRKYVKAYVAIILAVLAISMLDTLTRLVVGG